jgi:surface protein
MSIKYNPKVFPDFIKKTSQLSNSRINSYEQPWVRPADWLSVPVPSASEQKAVLLVAIYPNKDNYLSLLFQGAYTVDWGDGTSPVNVATNTQSNKTYDYNSISDSTLTSEGFKQVIVTVTPQSGQNLTTCTFKRRPPALNSNNIYVVPILEIYLSAPNATSINIGGADGLTANGLLDSLVYCNLINTAGLSTYTNFFLGMDALRVVDIGVISTTATTMQQMFGSCGALQRVTIVNATNITNMSYLFYNCFCLQAVSIQNTSKVTTFEYAFYACYNLRTVQLLDTSSVIYTTNMFNNCYGLVSAPLFNTSKVLSMTYMFWNCYSLQKIPAYNTSSATAMTGVFANCYSLKTIPLLDTSSATNMTSMFSSCYNLEEVPLLNTAQVTNMSSMFSACSSLKTIPAFNTANVTNMTSMFASCSSLKTIPTLNTSKVTNISTMFNGCTLLQSFTMTDASLVTSASTPFNNGLSLQQVELQGLRATVSVSATIMHRSQLEALFNSLGTASGAASITITQTPGAAGATAADQAISISSTTTSGSTTITMASTTNLSTGMQVVGTGSPLTTAAAVTTTASTSRINRTAHGLQNNDEVSFATVVTTTGITPNTIYYVVNRTDDDFQISTSSGGSALTFTNDGSGTIRYRTEIASIVPNTSVTVSRPMTASGTVTLVYRNLKTGTALLKGFSVSG